MCVLCFKREASRSSLHLVLELRNCSRVWAQVWRNGLIIYYFKGSGMVRRRKGGEQLKANACITLVPTDMLNTSPRVLTQGRMRAVAMPSCPIRCELLGPVKKKKNLHYYSTYQVVAEAILASGVPVDPRVSLSQVIFKNVLNGANWTSVASLGSQSNRGVPRHFLVRHKRGTLTQCLRAGGQWTSTRHSLAGMHWLRPTLFSSSLFLGMCVWVTTDEVGASLVLLPSKESVGGRWITTVWPRRCCRGSFQGAQTPKGAVICLNCPEKTWSQPIY